MERYPLAGDQEAQALNDFFGPRAKIVLLMAMRAIEAGDGRLGEYYLSQFQPEHLQQVNMLPSFLYWYGRAAYARGAWVRAAALFEKHRTLVPHDERAAFYAGNAYAHLGDWARARLSWQTAVQENNGFYEPRANLERGSLPLAMEQVTSFDLSDLLSQPARCADVPVFINARDRVGCLRQLVDWLLGAGCRQIHVLDNASTYPPLLAYYEEIRQAGVSIWYLRRNLGYQALWKSGILNLLHIDTAYVYTDPDVVPDAQCPRDIIYRLAVLLARHLPWYYDFAHLPEDERYYMEHAEGTSSVARHWREDVTQAQERDADDV